MHSSAGSFHKLVDITFVCAMGPPGGGRNPITPRFSRHFNYLSFTELEDTSKHRYVMGTLQLHLLEFNWCLSNLCMFIYSSLYT